MGLPSVNRICVRVSVSRISLHVPTIRPSQLFLNLAIRSLPRFQRGECSPENLTLEGRGDPPHLSSNSSQSQITQGNEQMSHGVASFGVSWSSHVSPHLHTAAELDNGANAPSGVSLGFKGLCASLIWVVTDGPPLLSSTANSCRRTRPIPVAACRPCRVAP